MVAVSLKKKKKKKKKKKNIIFFFFKQKTAYEMCDSDWSSDVCSSDLIEPSAFALFATGIGLMEITSLVERPILLTSQYESLKEYREYLESSTGDYDLYDADWNNRLSALALAQWSAGSAFTSSLLLFPPEQVTISLFGKITAIAGMGAAVTGSIFDTLALNQFIRADYTYMQYEAASSGVEELYTAYNAEIENYQTSTLIGMIVRGSGGLIGMLAPVMPGRKQPLATTPLHRGLFVSALLSFTASTFTKHAAQIQALQLNDLYAAYQESTSNMDEVYNDYRSANRAYTALNIATYSLWAAGGAAVITALFLPQKTVSGYTAAAGGDSDSRSAGPAEPKWELLNITAAPAEGGGLQFGFTLAK